jgi:hypothetical protein
MANNRPVVFAVCVKGGRKRQSEDVIAKIARRTYWHLSPPAERKKLRFPTEAAVTAAPDPEDETYDDIEELLDPSFGSKVKGPSKRKSKKKAPPGAPAKKLMK